MKRNQKNKTIQKIQHIQKLSKQLNIKRFPITNTTTQLHFQTTNITNNYDNPKKIQNEFKTTKQIIKLHYMDKAT